MSVRLWCCRPVTHLLTARTVCIQHSMRHVSSDVLPSKPTWSVRELLRKRDDVAVDKKDILKAAALCQISMSDKQLKTVTKEVEDLLHFIKHVQDQDVEGIEPTYSVKDQINRPRPDMPLEAQPDQAHITKHAKEV
ncbi:hypothetical protein SARC_10939 [Sphaeroforma arctica JP610]|uniref:Glutamyl-tRNA(Gln) amidotransferase subunit C, mitochondrial n=1 Tax=Sphaeroforma arctica JP610 TaxID=667725 RepID=A0A0L0FIK1_9EUKA|nr:hypothetical protein SARC_10939 [Sphaeroforma arctica JP610]KNC76565.1 hypothetical protein SARC_10939 [Sphaeroforma arctica JP610]|eukprot:XP_014150467.1 hypothetical protein SARC_10939 [Sphaeroforma arctica JP610]